MNLNIEHVIDKSFHVEKLNVGNITNLTKHTIRIIFTNILFRVFEVFESPRRRRLQPQNQQTLRNRPLAVHWRLFWLTWYFSSTIWGGGGGCIL